MKVTAKFRAHYIDKQPWGTIVKMSPVYSPDPASENYSWSQATPSGEIALTITNPAAAEQFEANQEYLISFERA